MADRGWRPYVPVAQRRAKAQRLTSKLKSQGKAVCPIHVEGRAIAKTFWGKAWCENLESYSDFENRLPRGRTYVRNGSVVDLQIEQGKIRATVSGSDVYQIEVDIAPTKKANWNRIKKNCAGSIDSLMDLLCGRFSDSVMSQLTSQKSGLFPKPGEISIHCSCPDWAYLCKHAAAVLYGVAARLDSEPELLFTLRDVDHLDLIGHAAAATEDAETLGGDSVRTLAGDDLSGVFGIDLESTADPPSPGKTTASRTKKRASKTSPSKKKSARRTSDTKKVAKPKAKKKTAAKKTSKKTAAARSTKPCSSAKKASRKKPVSSTAKPSAKKRKTRKKAK